MINVQNISFKNHKKMISLTITSPNCQCAVE